MVLAGGFQEAAEQSHHIILIARPQDRLLRGEKAVAGQSLRHHSIESNPMFIPAGGNNRAITVPHTGKQKDNIAGIYTYFCLAGGRRLEPACTGGDVNELVFFQNPPLGHVKCVALRMARRRVSYTRAKVRLTRSGDEKAPIPVPLCYWKITVIGLRQMFRHGFDFSSSEPQAQGKNIAWPKFPQEWPERPLPVHSGCSRVFS